MRWLSVEILAEQRVAFLGSELVEEYDWHSLVNGISGEEAAVPAMVLHEVSVSVVPDRITPLPGLCDEMIDDGGDAQLGFRTNPEGGCAVQHAPDSFAQEVVQPEFVGRRWIGDHAGFLG